MNEPKPGSYPAKRYDDIVVNDTAFTSSVQLTTHIADFITEEFKGVEFSVFRSLGTPLGKLTLFGPVGYSCVDINRLNEGGAGIYNHNWNSATVFGKDSDVQKFIRKFSAYALMNEALDTAEDTPLEVVAILGDVDAVRTGNVFCYTTAKELSDLIASAMAGLDLDTTYGVLSCDRKRFNKTYYGGGCTTITGPSTHAAAVIEFKNRVIDRAVYGPRQDVAAFIRRYSKALLELSLRESTDRDAVTTLPPIEIPWEAEKTLSFIQYPQDFKEYIRKLVDAFGLTGELTVKSAYWTAKGKPQAYVRVGNSRFGTHEPLTRLDAAAVVCIQLEYRGQIGVAVYGSMPAVEKFTRLFHRQLAVLQEPLGNT